MKQQNQSTKEGPRGKRSYQYYAPGLGKGIRWHWRLNNFLREYNDDFLSSSSPPPLPSSHPVYQLFWDHEQHRLAVDRKHWFPLAFELYLHTSTFRGIIDRVDPIDNHSCCLVEYKSSPKSSGFLHEELLFYALLASRSKVFNQKIARQVTQVGTYFYRTGEYFSREVTTEDLESFSEFLSSIREEIAQGIWFPKKDCSLLSSDCPYAPLCSRIPEQLKYRE